MKLLLFGATGGTGKQVFLQALQQGHTVTVVVRNPSKITVTNPDLKIIQGDVLTTLPDDAFTGQDAVICCLGAPANKAGALRSEGTKNIIYAMKKANVTRFICQSSLGFDDSVEVLKCTSFIFKKIIVPYVLKATFREHYLQEIAVKQSGLNWTIVRPGSLTNGKMTGKYKYGFSYADPALKVKISRGDVAGFLIKLAVSEEYLHNTTGISY
jgi:putative NADH-flavin reductase